MYPVKGGGLHTDSSSADRQSDRFLVLRALALSAALGYVVASIGFESGLVDRLGFHLTSSQAFVYASTGFGLLCGVNLIFARSFRARSDWPSAACFLVIGIAAPVGMLMGIAHDHHGANLTWALSAVLLAIGLLAASLAFAAEKIAFAFREQRPVQAHEARRIHDAPEVVAIKRLRGTFRRTASEFVYPVLMLGILFSLPAGVLMFAWTEIESAPLAIDLLLFVAIPLFGLYLLYLLTSTFEFDGSSITCRRLGARVAWVQPVAGLQSVSRFATSDKSQLKLRWPDRTRWVVITRDLQRALSQN